METIRIYKYLITTKIKNFLEKKITFSLYHDHDLLYHDSNKMDKNLKN